MNYPNTSNFGPKKGRFIYKTNYDSHRWNMASVQVTRNYQITLGRDIRRKIPVKIGEKMTAEVKGETIILKKMKKNPVEEAFGCWGPGKSGIEMVDELRASWRDFNDEEVSND